jgi:hypothetical protein
MHRQCAELHDWRGDASNQLFTQVLEVIASHVRRPLPPLSEQSAADSQPVVNRATGTEAVHKNVPLEEACRSSVGADHTRKPDDHAREHAIAKLKDVELRVREDEQRRLNEWNKSRKSRSRYYDWFEGETEWVAPPPLPTKLPAEAVSFSFVSWQIASVVFSIDLGLRLLVWLGPLRSDEVHFLHELETFVKWGAYEGWLRAIGSALAVGILLRIALGMNVFNSHIVIARFFELTRRTSAATAQYREASRQRPELAWVHHTIGDLLLSEYQLDDAFESYRTAATLEPTNANYTADYEVLSERTAEHRRLKAQPPIYYDRDKPELM